ncbi:MAG: hypothetical protein JNK53_05760, partial [Phycisphaerae bacterium]|nr:hypothetical protein [Phycisphaerae bacterium]
MQSPDEPPHNHDEGTPSEPPEGASSGGAFGDGASDESAWELEAAVPSAWVGFWPHDDPPSREEVGRAIASWIGREVEAEAVQ